MIHLLLLLAVAAVKTEINDITTIYQLGETSDRETIPIPVCYAGTQTCAWHQSGMQTVEMSATPSNYYKSNNEVEFGETSPLIPLSLEDKVVISIEPSISGDEEVELCFTSDSSGLANTDMLVLQLKSGVRSSGNKAYYCLSSYAKDSEKLLLRNKMIRNCNKVPFPVFTLPKGENPGSTDKETYRLEYSSVSHNLNVTKMVGSTREEEYVFEAKYLIFDINYLAISPKVSSLRYSNIVYGLKLIEDYGTLVSPNLVTKSSSRICVKVSATRRTSIKVLAVLNNGTSLELGETFGQATGQSSETVSSSFLADLSSYKHQTFDLQVHVKGYSFPEIVLTGISDCDTLANQTLVLRDPGIGEVRTRGNARGQLLLLPNGTIAGPNVNKMFSECTAMQNGCKSWSFDNQWLKSRSVEEASALNLGIQYRTEWIKDSFTAVNDFVDNVQLSMNGDFNDNENSNVSLFLMNQKYVENSTMFIIVFDKKKPENERVSLLMCDEDTSRAEIVYLTQNISRECKQITKEDSKRIPTGESTDEDYPDQGKDQVEETNVHDFNVQVVDDGDNRIITLKGKVFDDNGYEATFKPRSNFNLSHYQVGVHNGSGFIESSGIGSLFFSLDSTKSTINGTFSPTSELLCLEMNYFMDKLNDKNDIRITGKLGNSVLNFIQTPAKLQTDGWRKATFTSSIDNILEEQIGSISVDFSKSKESKLLIQRISDCNKDDEDIIQLFEGAGYTAMGHGANVDIIDFTYVSRRRCLNGGIFFDNHGCDCPPGFNGTTCEEGCGPNRYGADCGGECSDTTRGCRGMVMCRPMLGCDCATGYTGPFCDEQCTIGKNYGAGCKQTCGHCAAGLACDIYTGVCSQGCAPGYNPPYCLYDNTQLTMKPEVYNTNATYAKVKANFSSTNGIVDPKFYQLQYKMLDATEWLEQEIQTIPKRPSSDFVDAGELKSLQPGSKYQVRVVLIDISTGKSLTESVPVLSFKTECKVPDFNEYNMKVSTLPNGDGLSIEWQLVGDGAGECVATGYEIHIASKRRWTEHTVKNPQFPERPIYKITDLLGGTQYRVKIRATTIKGPMPFSETVQSVVTRLGEPSVVTNLKIRDDPKETQVSAIWNAPISNAGSDIKYNITVECVEYVSCPNPCNDIIVPKEAVTSLVSIYQKGKFLAHAIYNISVAAVATKAGFEDVTGRWSSVLYTSEQRVPRTPPIDGTQISSKDDTILRLQWMPPSENDCHLVNGAIIAYRCQLRNEDNTKDVGQPIITTQNFVKFESLKPNFNYTVNVFIVTSAGWNEFESLSMPVKTRAPSPNPVKDLVIYMKSTKMLALRWSKPDPKEAVSEIDYYEVSYGPESSAEARNTAEVKPTDMCVAYKDSLCAKLEGLTTNVRYRIEVKSHTRDNEVSVASTASGIAISDGVPTKPQNLDKRPMGDGIYKIMWNTPDLLNGMLNHFDIIVEHLYSDRGGCCDSIVTHTLNVEFGLEKMQYEYKIAGLRPNSNYEVSVKAVTSKHHSEKTSIFLKT